ncbi:MAG: RNA polymerase sigma factor [bacterium]|nr:RNA polymerase sigma factor [bacterium]
MDQHTEMEKSFLKLYDEFAGPIFRHCYFRVSSREVAEDLTQESFMRIWNHLAEGKVIDNQKAFLYKIAGNLIIDYYRKKKNVSLDALSENGFNPTGDDASSILDYSEGQHALLLVEKLEPPYRETITLRYVNDLSISEISEVIGESENVVSVRIHRGIEKLKKLFHYEKSN